MESGKTFNDDIRRTITANWRLAKKRVPSLHQALCFYQSLCLADSEVLRNRHLHLTVERYPSTSTSPKPGNGRNALHQGVCRHQLSD